MALTRWPVETGEKTFLVIYIDLGYNVLLYISSVKWSDPGHFLKSEGKFFLSFPCTLFLHIFAI